MHAIAPDVSARRAVARVPIEEPTSLFGRLVSWYSRRVYGDTLDNVLALAHHPEALKATLFFERRVARFDRLDPQLKMLAVMASAARIGCSWCLDFGYYASHAEGLSLEKARAVPGWREAELFTETERCVLAYAEAMTDTPPTVTDEMVAELQALVGVPAVVELTIMVAIENERSRFNAAMGLTSQGLAERCGLPDAGF